MCTRLLKYMFTYTYNNKYDKIGKLISKTESNSSSSDTYKLHYKYKKIKINKKYYKKILAQQRAIINGGCSVLNIELLSKK